MASDMMHLRLPADEAAILRAASKESNRTLQDEVRSRLRFDRDKNKDDEICYALADVMERVSTTASIFHDPKQFRNEWLAMVKYVIGKVIDDLGATEPDQETANHLASTAILSLRQSMPLETPEWAKARKALTPPKSNEANKKEKSKR